MKELKDIFNDYFVIFKSSNSNSHDPKKETNTNLEKNRYFKMLDLIKTRINQPELNNTSEEMEEPEYLEELSLEEEYDKSSKSLYDKISRFESSKPFGYKMDQRDLTGIDLGDANGHKTFGYGLLYHPNGQYMDQIKSHWTQTELETLYIKTVNKIRSKVQNWATSKNITLNQNQINSLTSACYNFGSRFLNWSVARKIAKDPNDTSIYQDWANFSNHQADEYPGLIKRRKSEADWYFGIV